MKQKYVTGRHYGTPQVLELRVVGEVEVEFYDTARGIRGIVTIFAPSTKFGLGQDVLELYDAGLYREI